MEGEGIGRRKLLILGSTGKTPVFFLFFPAWNPKVKLSCPDPAMLVGFAQAAV